MHGRDVINEAKKKKKKKENDIEKEDIFSYSIILLPVFYYSNVFIARYSFHKTYIPMSTCSDVHKNNLQRRSNLYFM